jgi:hypothetical protein
MEKRLKYFVLLLLLCTAAVSRADEGMWLLQIMQEQHSIDLMKKAGLRLQASDIYNPNGVSLKDAVGIFGGGCTGEIISADGLILTNHHCGYGAIQKHSSVEHDYLTNGFWSKSRSEELPNEGLQFRFVDKIVDVTDLVNADIKAGKIDEAKSFTQTYCSELAKTLMAQSEYKDKKYIEATVLPFYAGNCFYLIYYKVYSDIRMVAAPPSSVGKFGGETDNWMWPRHTGDFSMFRIYADKNGEPAAYNKNNIPLKTKKHLTISLKGVQEGDYAMVMGFPGRTSRYLTAVEVENRMMNQNDPRIKVRTAILDYLKKEMAANDTVRIQYASIYASSSNYWKNSIGMNKAIVDNRVLNAKRQQEKAFLAFAKNKPEYQGVVEGIDSVTKKMGSYNYLMTTLQEVFMGSQFNNIALSVLPIMQLKQHLTANDSKSVKKDIQNLEGIFKNIHGQNYNDRIERGLMKTILPVYAHMTAADQRPLFFKIIDSQFGGDYNKYVDNMFDKSIFGTKENFDAFAKNPTAKALDEDPGLQYIMSSVVYAKSLSAGANKNNSDLASLHKKYIRGLNEMNQPTPAYPDANFTMRLTYGNVKSYNPKDGVMYRYYTTTDGVLQKENPNDAEFVVPAKLKELIQNKDFGRYAMPNGQMPVCFLTTNDITGGNSGSPVMNADGELIGAAFDGNWESLSGDINFNNKLQRCICVDIRYILFIVDKLGGCSNLIKEMTLD